MFCPVFFGYHSRKMLTSCSDSAWTMLIPKRPSPNTAKWVYFPFFAGKGDAVRAGFENYRRQNDVFHQLDHAAYAVLSKPYLRLPIDHYLCKVYKLTKDFCKE
jgi:hypothetical protein